MSEHNVDRGAMEEQLQTLMHGSADLINEDDLAERLRGGRPLKVKAGFDPTAADLHLGHTVVFKKLREFQRYGHQVIFLIGDFTGLVGDPSGRNQQRQPVSAEQIKRNAATYCRQVLGLLDADKTSVRHNSEWMNRLDALGLLKLSAHQTVARMIERDDFNRRYRKNQPIAISEFLYPLLQAYDSVVLKADVELGGTDQTFNLLLGRELQKIHGQKPQIVLTMPILEGLDGQVKMSKSLGNYIAIRDKPATMFGKTMSISDELMWRYYDLLSACSPSEITRHKHAVEEGKNPRDLKAMLARELVERFHGAAAAAAAERDFKDRFQRRVLPEEVPRLEVHSAQDRLPLMVLLRDAGVTTSSSEAARMISQRAVRLDGEVVDDASSSVEAGSSHVYQVGKRKIFRIRLIGKERQSATKNATPS